MTEKQIGEVFCFGSHLLKVVEETGGSECNSCFFLKEGECSFPKGENPRCYNREDECDVKYIEVSRPHLYGSFLPRRIILQEIKITCENIVEDLEEMEEGEKKESTKALLNQYREIFEKLEGDE